MASHEGFARPESVLVVIYTLTGKVLLLQRADDPSFWQSVTGSLHWDETEPRQAAARELAEETAITDASTLCDLGLTYRYPILPRWRSRYAPELMENTEHVFALALPGEREITLDPAEHSAYVWLDFPAARRRATSWTNREAIRVVEERFRMERETVILVPGLWMPKWGLSYLAHGLGRCGFAVYRFSYASVRSDLRGNAAQLKRFIERLDRPAVHLVGHSLGGLVIRALLELYPALPVGRVVTLASPHQDSEVARQLARWRLGRRILGRSVQELLAGVPRRWAPPPRPIGVIRGNLGLGLGRVVYPWLPQPNDGVLSEPETRLGEAADEITLRVAHSGMLLSRQAVRQTCCFLQTGRFAR